MCPASTHGATWPRHRANFGLRSIRLDGVEVPQLLRQDRDDEQRLRITNRSRRPLGSPLQPSCETACAYLEQLDNTIGECAERANPVGSKRRVERHQLTGEPASWESRFDVVEYRAEICRHIGSGEGDDFVFLFWPSNRAMYGARHIDRVVAAGCRQSAKLVATEQVVGEISAVSERERIVAFLMRAEVRTQIRDWGVDATEAAARVAALSDDEVRHISARLDNLPAGQDLATTALILLSVFLFLIVLESFGVIDIFGFITPTKSVPSR